jgi:hypothetical protein
LHFLSDKVCYRYTTSKFHPHYSYRALGFTCAWGIINLLQLKINFQRGSVTGCYILIRNLEYC